MKKKTGIGQAELDLLIHIAENGPLTVRKAQESFGEPRGYVRTTVLQMMERLRAKGHLAREKGAEGLEYAAVQTAEEIKRDQIKGFVRFTLQGSASPLVAYLAEMDEISEEDLAQLRKIVEDAKKRGGS